MNAFTIKDLENLSGIKAHTIRIWEQRYSFLNPNRTDTNIRFYSNDELKTLLNIALLNKYGFKISHIDQMTSEDLSQKILSLSHLQAQQERIVNDLIKHMIDLEFEQFESVIDEEIFKRGIEKTIIQIVFPFLERVGVLWVTNHINPAQEHLVTNIIRQKLILGIETATSIFSVSKQCILFLPEGEHHEIGLLYLHYLLKSKGVKVIYLGANVPNKDIEFVCKVKSPDFIYTHLTSVANNFNFEKFLTQISAKIPNQQIYVSGHLTAGYKKRIPDNVFFKTSLTQVVEFIGTLHG
ncbi:MAG: MerR family transcriptional regulator [Bacteroidetes bacterium]|nr:MerR family transcriptional regulator [Bacteroidota bacterium]